MKTIAIVMLILASVYPIASIAQDATKLKADKAKLEAISERMRKGDNEAMLELSALEPSIAIPMLHLYAVYYKEDAERTAKARMALKQMPKAIDYLIAQIQRHIDGKFLDHDLYNAYQTLAVIASREAAEKMAPFLMDQTILQSGLNDVGRESIAALTAATLASMKLPDAPVKEDRGYVTDEELQLWREWWAKIKQKQRQ